MRDRRYARQLDHDRKGLSPFCEIFLLIGLAGLVVGSFTFIAWLLQ